MGCAKRQSVRLLCSGSGALAFEALSRGAAHVVMIEPNRTQAQFLQQNLELLRVQ